MKLRLDWDRFTFRMKDTLYMLKNIPTPFDVRISPGGEGLHIKRNGDYDYNNPLYRRYDDPRRLYINRLREENGVSHNILWDVKKGRRAGTWHTINNIVDILSFMTKLHEIVRTIRPYYYIYPLTNRGIGE